MTTPLPAGHARHQVLPAALDHMRPHDLAGARVEGSRAPSTQ